jgi:hypothetical protein
MLCGGQCGGVGEFLISMGLPFLALLLFKVKNWFKKIKDGRARQGSLVADQEPEAVRCSCGAGEGRGLAPQSIDPETIDWLEPRLQEKPGPQGIRGWLLFLCLNLTIIIPFSFLYQVNCAWQIFYSSGTQVQIVIFKQSLLYNVISITAMIFLSMFSFYAGLRLWGTKPQADKTTKLFLITQLTLMTIILSLRPLLLFSLDGNADSLGDIIMGLIPYISYFMVWYLYLCYSRRVRNTYGFPSNGIIHGSANSAESAEAVPFQPR